LDSLVSAVYGADLGMSKSERILHSCASSGVHPSSTYMIGDTVGDIQQGKLAGACTVAVTWGFHPKPRLLAAAPDFLADHPSDLLAILNAQL
jgi:phosphoglycolate phosphatase